MGRTTNWKGRIPEILKELDASRKQIYARPEIEVLFNVGRTQADSLMEKVGRVRASDAGPLVWVVSRGALETWLTFGPAGADALVEFRRKQALAQKLREADEEQKLRSIKIPAKPSDEWAMLRDIPGLEISPGTFTIHCSSVPDLLLQLWRFSKALPGEYDTVALKLKVEEKARAAS